jgi:plasmid stability protein
MARNFEAELIHQLKLRADRNGGPGKAKHREILRQALLTSKTTRPLKELLLAIPSVGEDSDFERNPDPGV